MGYFVFFLPSIVAMVVLVISLTYHRDKNGMIIGAMTTMVLFLFIKDKVAVAPAINMLLITFTLTYLVVSFFLFIKEKKDR